LAAELRLMRLGLRKQGTDEISESDQLGSLFCCFFIETDITLPAFRKLTRKRELQQIYLWR
jgi:hypothetical protein